MRINFTDQSAMRLWLIMALVFLGVLAVYSPDLRRVHAWIDHCRLEAKPGIMKEFLSTPGVRGGDYFIEDATRGKKRPPVNNCMITGWNMSHFLTHFAIGYVCPDKLIESQLLGASFELLEYMKFNCHDVVDLIANLSGFLFGRMVREI